MKLLIASNNAHKIREIKEIVGGFFDEVLSLKEAGVDCEAEETGDTFEENARIKAEAVLRLTGCAALADDSGLMVDALSGAPGVRSARYAGVHGNDAANNALLMKNLEGVPAPRTAQFVSAVALARPGRPVVVVTGVCKGQVMGEPHGENGFGYDPYFVPEGMTRTFAELPAEVKNAISHRARALDLLRRALEEEK
jgi:XTP/dITP diphosphohydrolase